MESLEQRLQFIKTAIKSGTGADEQFKREHNALLARIHEQNRRSDTLVELGATVCAQEPY